MCELLKPKIMEQVSAMGYIECLPDRWTRYKVKAFQTQVVAGTNFAISIEVSDDIVIVISVFKPLPVRLVYKTVQPELQLNKVIIEGYGPDGKPLY